MYKNEQESGYYKELPLSEILEVNMVHNELKRELTHYFEIKTHQSTYYIGWFGYFFCSWNFMVERKESNPWGMYKRGKLM